MHCPLPVDRPRPRLVGAVVVVSGGVVASDEVVAIAGAVFDSLPALRLLVGPR